MTTTKNKEDKRGDKEGELIIKNETVISLA